MKHNMNHQGASKGDKPFLKASGSVLLAIFASSHHWLHTLLIALGVTTLGTSLMTMPGTLRFIFLGISLLMSLWFLRVAKRKWRDHRSAAWVYLISSVLSIIIIAMSIPQMAAEFMQTPAGNLHQQHHQ